MSPPGLQHLPLLQIPEQQILSARQVAPAFVQHVPSARQIDRVGPQQEALSPAVLLQHMSPTEQQTLTVKPEGGV